MAVTYDGINTDENTSSNISYTNYFRQPKTTNNGLYAGLDMPYNTVAPVINLKYGAQNGFLPNIGGVDAANNNKRVSAWISDSPYVRHNIIPVVLRVPRVFELLDPSIRNDYIKTYISLLDSRMISISGLDTSLRVDTDGHMIGASGTAQFEVPVNVMQNTTGGIMYEYNEVMGASIQKFFTWFIKFAIGDTHTKVPLVATKMLNLLGRSSDDSIGSMLYDPSFYTACVLYIEPDLTRKQVINAWLCDNMFPKNAGDKTGSFRQDKSGEKVGISIEFSALCIDTGPVEILAKSILDRMSQTTHARWADKDMIIQSTIDQYSQNNFHYNNGYSNNLSDKEIEVTNKTWSEKISEFVKTSPTATANSDGVKSYENSNEEYSIKETNGVN
jgi:hypothetical protein